MQHILPLIFTTVTCVEGVSLPELEKDKAVLPTKKKKTASVVLAKTTYVHIQVTKPSIPP